MNIRNDPRNLCTCGHQWSNHMHNGHLGWCSDNQIICDCWKFVEKYTEKRVIFDLGITK